MDRRRSKLVVRQGYVLLLGLGFISLAASRQALAESPSVSISCSSKNTIHAEVVALDQVIMVNRLGTVRPEGMIYALLRDVRPIKGYDLEPGNVQLRADKRPRPLVLRVHEGDCLEIAFQNFLSKDAQPWAPGVTSLQAVTRNASIHVAGMQLVKGITDDGIYVGANPR